MPQARRAGSPAGRSKRPRGAADGGDERAAAPAGVAGPWVRLRTTTSHPFVYQKMIASADPAAEPGGVVAVYDKSGGLVGHGLYNPRSQIAVRMLCWGERPIDPAFWRERLGEAIALRRRLELDAVTDAYRLVHAEGDGLSGLIVERYADVLVFELFSLGMFEQRELIFRSLTELLGPPASLDRPARAAEQWQLIVRADERIEAIEGFRVPPPAAGAPRSTVVREQGVRYRVDLAAGQKTGFFCDQRDNRRRLAGFCRDAAVLDMCCYSGGFGLCAKILGGAREVTSVDLDEHAIALARENANLNQVRIEHVHADAFPYLRQMHTNGRQYDVIVLDPPKLAGSRREVDDALRKYHDLNALAMRVLRPGGILLTCSCSGLVGPELFRETVARAARLAGRRVQVFDQTQAAADHPVMMNCPESAYLKALWLRVM